MVPDISIFYFSLYITSFLNKQHTSRSNDLCFVYVYSELIFSRSFLFNLFIHLFLFCLFETGNYIGNEDAKAIAEALKTNKTLTTLELYGTYHTPSSLILSWLSIRLSHHACVYDDEKHEKKKEYVRHVCTVLSDREAFFFRFDGFKPK